jgi:hypothetical protein
MASSPYHERNNMYPDEHSFYQVGDTIEYLTFGGERRQVIVTNKDDDIKNGRPGFDGTLINETGPFNEVWGYDDQIVRVYAKATS